MSLVVVVEANQENGKFRATLLSEVASITGTKVTGADTPEQALRWLVDVMEETP